jgi:hypothetical protein
MRAKEFVAEKWSAKYKRSINCNNPRGFSQRAHCAGRKKANEAVGANYNTARSIARDIHDLVTDIGQAVALEIPNKQQYIDRLRAEMIPLMQDLRDLGWDYDPQGQDYLARLTIDNDPGIKITEQQIDEILMFKGSPCTVDCSGHRAGYEWYKRKRRVPNSRSQSFNNGANIAAAGK